MADPLQHDSSRTACLNIGIIAVWLSATAPAVEEALHWLESLLSHNSSCLMKSWHQAPSKTLLTGVPVMCSNVLPGNPGLCGSVPASLQSRLVSAGSTGGLRLPVCAGPAAAPGPSSELRNNLSHYRSPAHALSLLLSCAVLCLQTPGLVHHQAPSSDCRPAVIPLAARLPMQVASLTSGRQ